MAVWLDLSTFIFLLNQVGFSVLDPQATNRRGAVPSNQTPRPTPCAGIADQVGRLRKWESERGFGFIVTNEEDEGAWSSCASEWDLCEATCWRDCRWRVFEVNQRDKPEQTRLGNRAISCGDGPFRCDPSDLHNGSTSRKGFLSQT